MGVVDQPVQDGVGQGRVADLFVPEFQGQLTGHQGGLESMPVFEDFQEIMALLPTQGRKAVIIEHQQVCLGHGGQQLEVAAVTPGQALMSSKSLETRRYSELNPSLQALWAKAQAR